MSWIALFLIAGFLCYLMTADERARLARRCRELVKRARAEVRRRWVAQPTADLIQRAPLPLATLSIVLVNLLVLASMWVGSGSSHDAETLLPWGASFGPRTTNGEWWRLVTATFVHASWLHAFAMFAGFIQLGCITERMAGPFALASGYVAIGTFANLVCLSTSPVAVTLGGANSVLGVYGLLAGTCAWRMLRGAGLPFNSQQAKRLVPGIVFFLVYAVATGRFEQAASVGAFAAGTINGLVLARGAVDFRRAARRATALTSVTATLTIMSAAPLSGMADVRPHVQRVIAMEGQVTRNYDAAVALFNNGAIGPRALSDVIDQTVLPKVRAAQADLTALRKVPREHQPLVAIAREYLRLRDQSWVTRSEALRSLNTKMLKDADLEEWRAREILSRLAQPH